MAITTGHTAQRPARTAYELLGRVCKAIVANPEQYNQNEWGDSWDYCGSGFCVAGWIGFLYDGRPSPSHIRRRAMELLDMQQVLAWELFTPIIPELYSNMPPVPGSLAYARVGVRHTRRFMAKYKDHLKARTLKGV